MTPEEIAPIAKCGKTLLRDKVKELLPYCYRDRSEAQILLCKKKAAEEHSFPIDKLFREQLIGSMLADGCIATNFTKAEDGNVLRYGNTAYFTLAQNEIHTEYVESLAGKVENTGLGFTILYKTDEVLLKDGTPSYSTRFKTMGSVELMEWFWDWYRLPTSDEIRKNPDLTHIKILPEWLKASDFTPYVLYLWYLEDGSYKNKWCINLLSLTFTKTENERLTGFLRKVLGIHPDSDDIKVFPRKSKNSRLNCYYYIRLKQNALEEFFAYTKPYHDIFPTYRDKFP